jgi:HKD family nuclease
MFDTANNRLSYSELLQPDIGYKLDFAIGLTYSLDLEALLGIPVSLGLLDEVDSELMKSPFYLLEAIRKSSNNLAIFCNAGSISLPHNIQSVYSLLENSVFEVKLPNRQNFHPKLWIIKYKNNEGKSYIKLIVLSRNLTFDNSIDLCVAMQGEITRKKSNKNKPIADMLTYVGKYAGKEKKLKILELANELLYLKPFNIIHPFEKCEFIPLGIDGYKAENTKLFNYKNDIFVVSPFLSEDVISQLSNASYNKVLITRKDSVTSSVIKSFDRVYITKDILNNNEFGVKQDIHAKLYFTITDEGNYLYLGSANASHNAFHKNVEFLIRLKYKPNCMGFKTFLNDFIPDENCPYEIIDSVPEKKPIDEDQIAIDHAFKEAVYSIKFAKVIVNEDSYDVNVESKPLQTKENIKIAPMQRQDLFQPLHPQIFFSGMLRHELSEFFVLSIQGQKIVVKIQMKGMPTDRDDSIYKSIINSKGKFLSYVSFMLSEDYGAGILEEAEYLRMMNDEDIKKTDDHIVATIYEKMLRAIHQNPATVKEIAEVIKRLDNEIIGRDFLEMYKQFERAARRLVK